MGNNNDVDVVNSDHVGSKVTAALPVVAHTTGDDRAVQISVYDAFPLSTCVVTARARSSCRRRRVMTCAHVHGKKVVVHANGKV